MASASVLPCPSPKRLLPPQPRPATLTRSPVLPSVTYSIISSFWERLPCLLPPNPPEPAGRPIAYEKPLNVFGEFDLGVILGLVAQHLAGIGQGPESAGVVANAVYHLPGDAVFVLNMGRVDGFAKELCEVARTDIGSQVAFVGPGVTFVQGDIEFTRRTNA